MPRRKANITEVEGFRESYNDFFYYSIKWDNPTHKEDTPFIFFNKNKVENIGRITELLHKVKNKEILKSDVILKAWVGKYRADVFSFKVSELIDFLETKKK